MTVHNNVYLAEILKPDGKETYYTQIVARFYHDACRVAKNLFTTRFVRVLPLEE
jgi:hypothetical protein